MATAIAQQFDDDDTDDQIGFDLPEEASKLKLEYIPRAQIHPDPDQPRKRVDAEDKESIKAAGILQPISVRFVPPELDGFCADCARSWSEIAANAEYMIIFGERRWRSAEGVMDPMPAIVRQDVTSGKRLRLVQMIENHGRKNLEALEDARRIRQLLEDDPSLSQNKLAKILSMAPSTLKDRIALLRNEAWLPLLETGEITTSQMVEVARFDGRSQEEQARVIDAMRDHAGTFGAGLPLSEMDVKEFARVLGDAFVVASPAWNDDAQTTLDTLAGPTTGGSDVALEPESGDPSNTLAAAPDSAALQAARHQPMRLVFRSGLKASLTEEQRQQTLATQPDFFVSRSLLWVEQKLKGVSADFLLALLEWDKAVLKLEFKLRDAESRDAVAADAGAAPPITAATTRQETLDLPANHAAAVPGPSGTALSTEPEEGSSSEATQVADASAPVGRTEAGLPDPSSAAAAPSSKKDEAAKPRPTFIGLFSQLEDLVCAKGRPIGITIGPAKEKGRLRVTFNVIGKVPGIGGPLVIDGTGHELDNDLSAYVRDYLAGKKIASVRKPAATAEAKPAAAAKPASKKSSTSKNKTPDKYKPVFPKKQPAKKKAPKPVQKKAAPKPPKAPKPNGLYPSQALADVIGTADAIKKPKAIKLAITYAKSNRLIGSGALRNAVSVDEKLRALVGPGGPMVTLAQFKSCVIGALSKTPTARAAAPIDPAQMDIVDVIEAK